MIELKFNQQNYGKAKIKSNDPLKLKFNQMIMAKLKLKYLSHNKPRIDSNPKPSQISN